MKISKKAGQQADPSDLVNIPKLITAYYTGKPNPMINEQKIAFGTSGHRGTSLKNSFNENHILAITQAICFYRKEHKIDGPLFLGFDTHALSEPAFATTMEVLAANAVEVMIAGQDEYTPTPVISHAILKYNKARRDGLADGIVITPSHNPPDNGGFKYNPPNGGPAATAVTKWIENKANEILKNKMQTVSRISFNKALHAPSTHRYDYLNNYVRDLSNIIDMDIIRESKIKIGIDPLGGAGVHYWGPIAEQYRIDLTVTNTIVDPTFSFMNLDWDGKIRMDPSSQYAMQGLLKLKNRFDISFGCDTDHDRHGIVSPSAGLMSPNNYLSVAISYLLENRPQWRPNALIGKTVVTTALIDRIAAAAGRGLYDVPVGFKWFAEGLESAALCFAAEESAGATFSRMDGSVWTTDKDGIVPCLLSAEIKARTDKDPGEIYQTLTEKYGNPVYDRVEARANEEEKAKLEKLSAKDVQFAELAGEKITAVITEAPGNNAPIGGLKVVTKNGWFAARPSGTEEIYKIYAESFSGQDHLKRLLEEAQNIVDHSLGKNGESGKQKVGSAKNLKFANTER